MSENQITAPAADAAPVVRSGDFTPAELQTMAQWAIADGRMTPEQASEALALDGVAMDSKASPIDAHLAANGMPPASERDFDIPPLAAPGAEYGPAERAFDGQVRNYLAAGKFDRERGSSLAKAVADVAAKMTDADPGTAELYRRTEEAKLQRLWGDQYPAKRDMARRFVAEIEAKQPGLVALLEASRAGDSAMVISAIAYQAELLAARKG